MKLIPNDRYCVGAAAPCPLVRVAAYGLPLFRFAEGQGALA